MSRVEPSAKDLQEVQPDDFGLGAVKQRETR